MFKRMMLAAVAAAGLAGCAQWDAARATAIDLGAQAADRGVEDSVGYLCRGARVGALRRWIGGDDDLMAAWNYLCARAEAPVLYLPPLSGAGGDGSDGAGQGAAPAGAGPGGRPLRADRAF